MKNSLTKNNFIQRCSQYFFIGYLFLLLGCSSDEKKVATATPSSNVTALDSIGTWLSNEKNYFEKNYHQVFFQHYTAQLKQQNIDSAAHLLYIALDNAVHHESLNAIYDSILVKEALSFTTQYENKIEANRLLDIYDSIGRSFFNNNAYSSSLIYYHKVLAKAADPERNKAARKAYRLIASVYVLTDQLDSANQYALRTLKISENIGDTLGIYWAYDVLANIYYNMGNIDEAMKYLQKYIEITKIKGDSAHIFSGYNNKVTILYTVDNPQCVEEIDTLLNFYNQWQPKKLIYKTRTQMWIIHKLVHQNKLDAAKLLLDSLAPFVDDRNVIAYPADYYIALADYEKQKGQGTAHKALFDQKMKEKIEEKVWHDASIYCEILRHDAELRKDYKDAFTYQKTYKDIRDSLTNKELKRTIIDLDKKYQTEKKELIIKQQAADAFKKNIFIAFLLVGFAALFYFYYTVRKKNAIISQQNELNEHTIAILSHDIKEPLLGVKLMLKRLNKDDPFVAQASQSLEGQINAVNGILTNLLKMKKLALTKKDKNVQADVNMVVKNVLQELNVAIQTKALTIENELTEGVVLPIAPEKLQIIVHNLLSNAVKYSFPNQKIRIFREGKGFCIQDFGVGLSPEQRSKLMREVTASQRGTKQERGNGLGLFLVGTMLQGEAIKVIFDSPEIGGTIAKVLG